MFIVFLQVFALIGRHVPGAAVRAVVITSGRPFVGPGVTTSSAAVVIAKVSHQRLRHVDVAGRDGAMRTWVRISANTSSMVATRSRAIS